MRGVVFFAAVVFAGAGVSPAAAPAALRVVVALAGAAFAVALFAAGAAFAGAALAGAVLAGAAFVAAVLLAAVFVVAGLALVPVVARLEATVFLAVLVAAATPVPAGSIATVMPCSPSGPQDDAAAGGAHVSGAHGLGHLRARQ